jgi:hypothetical protein
MRVCTRECMGGVYGRVHGYERVYSIPRGSVVLGRSWQGPCSCDGNSIPPKCDKMLFGEGTKKGKTSSE